MKLQFTNEQSKRLMARNAFSILETAVCKKDQNCAQLSATGVLQLSDALQHHLHNVIQKLKKH